jgi:hypothetical protein
MLLKKDLYKGHTSKTTANICINLAAIDSLTKITKFYIFDILNKGYMGMFVKKLPNAH